MKYTTILLDLDGTLLNTLEDLKDSMNYMLAKYNQPLRSLEEIRLFVGNGLRKLAERAISDSFDMGQFETFLAEFIAYYNDHNLIKTAPYPRVIETTKELSQRGVKLAIVTNKAQEASESLLEDFFYPHIQVVVGDGGGRAHKPAPDNVDEALKQLSVSDKSKVLYVGDSEVDAQTGENSNLDYILCTYGFRDMNVLKEYSPIAFIDSFDKLLDYI